MQPIYTPKNLMVYMVLFMNSATSAEVHHSSSHNKNTRKAMNPSHNSAASAADTGEAVKPAPVVVDEQGNTFYQDASGKLIKLGET